jgi:hypothetical protein
VQHIEIVQNVQKRAEQSRKQPGLQRTTILARILGYRVRGFLGAL